MRFLVDNQLPAALARFIVAACGHECDHVLDAGLAQTSDSEICRYVEQHGITLISKDEDFLRLGMRPGSTLRLVWGCA